MTPSVEGSRELLNMSDGTAHFEWRDWAACRGMDPNLFAPLTLEDVRLEAFDTCAGCPVQLECISAARRNGSHPWVVHGGLFPTRYDFRGARIEPCGFIGCGRRLVIGGRAEEVPYCSNRCRFRQLHHLRRVAGGEVPLFDWLEQPAVSA